MAAGFACGAVDERPDEQTANNWDQQEIEVAEEIEISFGPAEHRPVDELDQPIERDRTEPAGQSDREADDDECLVV